MPKTVLTSHTSPAHTRLAAVLVAAALSLVSGPGAADPLVIDSDGTVTLGGPQAPLVVNSDGVVSIGAANRSLIVEHDKVRVDTVLNFGSRTGPLMTLSDPGYEIGVQQDTLYSRTDRNFAWFQGGTHDDSKLAPGKDGKLLMALSSEPDAGEGTLHVVGSISADTGFVGGTSISIEQRTDYSNKNWHPTDLTKSFYVTALISDGSPADDNTAPRIEFRHSNGTQGIGFGYNTIYATGSITDQPLKLKARGASNVEIVGNGNLDVKGKLLLANDWNITTTDTTLQFSKGDKAIMRINSKGNLEYNLWQFNGETYSKEWGMLTQGRYDYLNGTWGYWYTPSDARLKDDITEITGALDKLRSIRGVSFHWNARAIERVTTDFPSPFAPSGAGDQGLGDSGRVNLGVIAQEVEAVLPASVRTDADGYLSVHYRDLIPLLIEAVKEQDKIVAAQAERMADLEAQVVQLATVVSMLATASSPGSLQVLPTSAAN